MSLYFINAVTDQGRRAVTPLTCSHAQLPLVATAWEPPSISGSSSSVSGTYRVLISTSEGDCIAYIDKNKCPSAMAWHPRRKLLMVGWEDGTMTTWSAPVIPNSAEHTVLSAPPDSPLAMLLSRSISTSHSAAVAAAGKSLNGVVQNVAVVARNTGVMSGKGRANNSQLVSPSSPSFVFVGTVAEIPSAAPKHTSSTVSAIQWTRNGTYGVSTSNKNDVVVWVVEEKSQDRTQLANGASAGQKAGGAESEAQGNTVVHVMPLWSTKAPVPINGVCHIPSTVRAVNSTSPLSGVKSALKPSSVGDGKGRRGSGSVSFREPGGDGGGADGNSSPTTAYASGMGAGGQWVDNTEDELSFALCGVGKDMWYLDDSRSLVPLLSVEADKKIISFLYDPELRFMVTLSTNNMIEVHHINQDNKAESRVKGKVAAPPMNSFNAITSGGTMSSRTSASLAGIPGICMAWADSGLVVLGCGDDRLRFFSLYDETITSLVPLSLAAAITSANLSSGMDSTTTSPAISPDAESGLAKHAGSAPDAGGFRPLPSSLGASTITSIAALPQRRKLAIGTAEGVVLIYGTNGTGLSCHNASAWHSLALLSAHSEDADTGNGDLLRQKITEKIGSGASGSQGATGGSGTPSTRRVSNAILSDVSVDSVRWTAQGDIGVCYSGSRFKLFHETSRQRVWDGIAAATQVTSDIVVIESITGCQCLLHSTSNIKGLSLSFPHIALWNGNQIDLYAINETTSTATLINFVSTSSGAFALHPSGLLLVRERSRVSFVSLQIQPIAHLNFSDSEGEPVMLDVMDDFMVAVTNRNVMKIAKVGNLELRQLGPARELFKSNSAESPTAASTTVPPPLSASVMSSSDLDSYSSVHGRKERNSGASAEFDVPDGPVIIVNAKVNAQGKRVALMTRVGLAQTPDTRIWVFDCDTDKMTSYDFFETNEQPDSLYWNRPASEGNTFGELGYLLLTCETHGVNNGAGTDVSVDPSLPPTPSAAAKPGGDVRVVQEEGRAVANGGANGDANKGNGGGRRRSREISSPSEGGKMTDANDKPIVEDFDDGYGATNYAEGDAGDVDTKMHDMENLVEKQRQVEEALRAGVSSAGAAGCFGLHNSQHNLVTLFATPTSMGVVRHNSVSLQRYQICLVGLTIPDFLLASVRIGGNAGNPADYVIEQKRLRDFDDLKSDRDVVVREALMKFSYYATIGNMDEAYRAVKSVKNSNVWHSLATMCVTSGRLDVAEVCLAQMEDGVGARAMREAREEFGDNKEVQLGVLACSLGMIEESENLFRAANRPDLITNLYVACGLFDQANKHAMMEDRIHARTVAYKCAQFQESQRNFDSAIFWYHTARCAGTDVARLYNQRGLANKLREIVLKTANDPATADMVSTKELLCSLAQFNERRQRLSESVSYYSMAKDHYNVVRILVQGFNPPRVSDATDVVNGLIDAAQKEAKTAAMYGSSRTATSAALVNDGTQDTKKLYALLGNTALEGAQWVLQLTDGIQPIGAAYFLGLHHEDKGDIPTALKFYAHAGAHRRGAHVCREMKRYGELVAFALRSQDRTVIIGTAHYLEEQKMYDKAVALLRYVGETMHAIDVCVRGNLFDTLVQISEDLYKQAERHNKSASRAAGGQGAGSKSTARRSSMDSTFGTAADDEVDPDVFRQMSKHFASSRGYEDRAAEMLILAKDYDDALQLCLEKRVKLTEEMADAMQLVAPVPPPPVVLNRVDAGAVGDGKQSAEEIAAKRQEEKKVYELAKAQHESEKTELFKKIAHVAKEQQSWNVACKYYTYAGERLKAMKALVRAGDNEKIIFFANHSRNTEIYVIAGNYLQSQDWVGSESILQAIVSFYKRAHALNNLVSFYDLSSHVYVDEHRNYDLALKALQNGAAVLNTMIEKASSDGTGASAVTTYASRLDDLQQRAAIVARVAKAKGMLAPGKSCPELISICSDIIIKNRKAKKGGAEEPKKEETVSDDPALQPYSPHLIATTIQMGDVYALLAAYYLDGVKELRNAYSVLEAMQKEEIAVYLFIEADVIKRICDGNDKTAAPFLEDKTKSSNKDDDGVDDDALDDSDGANKKSGGRDGAQPSKRRTHKKKVTLADTLIDESN